MSTPSTSRACARDHSPERKRTRSPFRLRARTPRAGGALGRRRRRGRTRSARGPGRGRRRHPRSRRFAGGGAGFEDAERRVPRRAQPIHPRQGAGRRHRLRERARGRRLQHSDGYVARDGARVERSRPAARFRADRWSRRARRALLSGSGVGRRRRAFAVYRRRLDRRQSGARCADDAPPRPLSPIWVRQPCRLRHARAYRGARALGSVAASSTLVPPQGVGTRRQHDLL